MSNKADRAPALYFYPGTLKLHLSLGLVKTPNNYFSSPIPLKQNNLVEIEVMK